MLWLWRRLQHQAGWRKLLLSCPQCNFSESDHGKNKTRLISALNPVTRAQVLHNKIDFSVYCAAEPK